MIDNTIAAYMAKINEFYFSSIWFFSSLDNLIESTNSIDTEGFAK